MKASLRRARAVSGATLAGLLGAFLSFVPSATAQPARQKKPAPAVVTPAPAVPAVPAVPAAPDDQDTLARQAEARARFEAGLAHFAKDEWDAALTEFIRSRKATPTRSATKYAATCLQELRRFDEALDLFEEVLAFPNLAAKDLKYARDGIASLQPRVGTLVIKGGEPGASIVVDGRYRGTLPLAGPLRVSTGSHEIGAFKEGLDPFGATTEVVAKQSAVAQLRSLSTGGRLKVSEQRARVLDVLIDGTVVGKTPWEGPLAVGDHLVTLRGNASLDSGAECAPTEIASAGVKRPAARGQVELGTQPVSVPIRLQDVTKLSLLAEELDTTLRIEPMPGGASIAIDSVVVGRGAWEGRLRVGEHKLEVLAEGFLPETARVRLERGKRLVIPVELRRDRNTPEWRAARNGWAGAAFGVGALGLGVFAVTGSLALARSNELRSTCTNGLCPASEQASLDAARTLGTVASVGAVVAGVGVATGAVILLVARPGENDRRAGGSGWREWRVGVGPAGAELRGTF
jgi:hypothetical protein